MSHSLLSSLTHPLLGGFPYRRDRSVWRCLKASCKGRAHPDGITCKMYQHHICRAPDPNEIEKALFNYWIKKKAAQYHDLTRLIVHEARLKLSSDAAITSPQYTVSQIIINVFDEMKIFHQIFKILLQIKNLYYTIIMIIIVDY